MGQATITNPAGAFGATPQNPSYSEGLRNADTVALAKGDVVVVAFSATTGECSVTKAATTTDLDFLFGVCDQTIAVGSFGRIILRGFAFVNVGGNTVANGDGVQRSGATAGIAVPITEDATTISGQIMGQFLGVKGTGGIYPGTNIAPCWVGKF